METKNHIFINRAGEFVASQYLPPQPNVTECYGAQYVYHDTLRSVEGKKKDVIIYVQAVEGTPSFLY